MIAIIIDSNSYRIIIMDSFSRIEIDILTSNLCFLMKFVTLIRLMTVLKDEIKLNMNIQTLATGTSTVEIKK